MRYLIFLCMLIWCAAYASASPMLQLDTGGHMAAIGGIAFTPDGKQLISAGDDKVIRVWDLASGETVRTIRGESALGNLGKIFAMTLSLDGKWLAVGGDLGSSTGAESREDEKVQAIRLYDFKSGKLVALLMGHKGVVRALGFSADGRKLISGGGDNTAIIWDTGVRFGVRRREPKLLHRLVGHKSEIFGAAFSPDGRRVVTGSYDKDLRLWQVSNGAQIALMVGHGDKVMSLAFAPNGIIASGDIAGGILLWDGRSGRFLRALAQQKIGAGSLSFGHGGKLLLSTCGFGGCGGAPAYVYDVASGQKVVSYYGHDNAVLASAFSLDGRWIATGGGADWEIHLWNPLTGKRRLGVDGQPLRLGGQGQVVWAAGFSADGRQIGWGNVDACPNKSHCPNEQIILQKALALPLEGATLGAPATLTERDANTFHHTTPSYNRWSLSHRAGGNYGYDNAVLDIVKDGHVVASITRAAIDGFAHHAYSFAPDGESIISAGSDGVITAYDREGKMLGAFVGHDGNVFAVAPSPDGRYLVSSSADETVRLWNLKTRELLVSLFQGKDGEWVMWTPEGFFTGSENGAKLIGWQINQGPDKEALFVTADQLRKAFFRPDLVIQKIACAQDSDDARKDCNNFKQEATRFILERVLASGPPPKVEILSTVLGEDDAGAFATITAQISDQNGGVSRIEGWVNGQNKFNRLGGMNTRGEISIRFDLASAENTIEVLAWNKALFVTSPRARTSVNVDRKALDRITSNLYVLALGVDIYHKDKSLAFAVNDAQTLGPALAAAGKDLYRDAPEVVTLRNDEVTADRITLEFNKISSKVRATDVFVLFIAGHGKTISGNYYFLPGNIEDFSNATIEKDGFSGEQWKNWLATIKAEKSIWLIDTCEAGSARTIFNRAGYDRLQKDLGRTILMAASEEQVALEGYRNHGAFTYAALDGLANANFRGDDTIQILGLISYMDSKLNKIGDEMTSCKGKGGLQKCQELIYLPPNQNYPIAKRYLAAGDGSPRLVKTSTDLLSAVGGTVIRRIEEGGEVNVLKIEGGWATIIENGQVIGIVPEADLLRQKEK